MYGCSPTPSQIVDSFENLGLGSQPLKVRPALIWTSRDHNRLGFTTLTVNLIPGFSQGCVRVLLEADTSSQDLTASLRELTCIRSTSHEKKGLVQLSKPAEGFVGERNARGLDSKIRVWIMSYSRTPRSF